MDDVIEALNRSAKLFIDSGSAGTVEEAVQRLQSFRVHIAIGQAASRSPTHQAALLTAVNCGRRTFLGGVSVSGALGTPLAVPVVPGSTLADAVSHLQGHVVEEPPAGVPLIVIGTPTVSADAGFAVWTTFEGWRAAVLPLHAEGLRERREFAPSGVLAGALAVAQVFAHLDGDALAGQRAIGMSLWDMAALDWRSDASDGAIPDALPAEFWVIGLGHLGQAYLWTIGCLPYAAPDTVALLLQDDDVAGESTESTSLLTFAAHKGEMKTRICASWAQMRGFTTRIVERRFGTETKVAYSEPTLALCGVDNPQARSLLEDAGFESIFEAGLGDGVADFRQIRTHSFPGSARAADIWAAGAGETDREAIDELPIAYGDLRDRGALDQCGLTRLAGVAVGAPFVGTVAAAMLISQVIRLIVDGRRPTVLNVDLTAPQHRSAVMPDHPDIVQFRTTDAAAAELII